MTDTTSSGYGIGSFNPYRYRGYIYDDETGLYYLRSRYYDPQTGRFINADDTAYIGITGTALSANLFSYCENNPLNKIDITGHFSWGLFIDIVLLASSFTPFTIWLKCAILVVYAIRLGVAIYNYKVAKDLYKKHKINSYEWGYQKMMFVFTVGLVIIGTIATLMSAPTKVIAKSVARTAITAINKVWGTAVSASLIMIDFLKFVVNNKKPPKKYR